MKLSFVWGVVRINETSTTSRSKYSDIIILANIWWKGFCLHLKTKGSLLVLHLKFRFFKLVYTSVVALAWFSVNPIQNEAIQAVHGWWGGGAKSPPLLEICHTYLTRMKLGAVILYLKQIFKGSFNKRGCNFDDVSKIRYSMSS